MLIIISQLISCLVCHYWLDHCLRKIGRVPNRTGGDNETPRDLKNRIIHLQLLFNIANTLCSVTGFIDEIDESDVFRIKRKLLP